MNDPQNQNQSGGEYQVQGADSYSAAAEQPQQSQYQQAQYPQQNYQQDQYSQQNYQQGQFQQAQYPQQNFQQADANLQSQAATDLSSKFTFDRSKNFTYWGWASLAVFVISMYSVIAGNIGMATAEDGFDGVGQGIGSFFGALYGAVGAGLSALTYIVCRIGQGLRDKGYI